MLKAVEGQRQIIKIVPELLKTDMINDVSCVHCHTAERIVVFPQPHIDLVRKYFFGRLKVTVCNFC